MFAAAVPNTKPSRYALYVLLASTLGAVLLIFADGLLEGRIPDVPLAVLAWVRGFRYLFEQGIYASTVFWAAAKFTETRTLLTVGFNRQDAGAVQVRGPDEANTVWIGRRYDTRMEAEAVAVALEARLRASSTA